MGKERDRSSCLRDKRRPIFIFQGVPAPPVTRLSGQEPVDEVIVKGYVPDLLQMTMGISQDYAPKGGWVTVKCEV